MFSTRTLPITQRELFGIFLVKDLVYYSVLFILPVTIGLAPVYFFTEATVTVGVIALTFVSLTLMFLLGTTVAVLLITFLAAGVVTRSFLAVIGGAVAAAVAVGTPVLAITPYGLHVVENATDVVLATTPVLASIITAFVVYSPASRSRNRSVSRGDSILSRVIPDGVGALPVKMVFDVHRSSGGVWKIAFAAGLIFLVTAFVLWGVETALYISVNSGIAFGALLPLTAFTTHMWLTRLDDLEEYLFHPLSVRDVFAAKYTAFTLFTIPILTGFYAASVVYQRPELMDAVMGAVILLGMTVYVFGVTVYIAGLEPNDFMFDTGSFVAFSLAVMIAVLPVVVVSFVTPFPETLAAGLFIWTVLLGSVGVVACRAAPSKWSDSL